ncbi:MAG TPA: DUF3551 domain-containing protein [Xanthobacteraceae bacterium]
MKLHLQSAVLAAAAVLALTGSAFTQETVRANERYCLQSYDPSPAPLLCRFESLQQCSASRTSPSDYCLLNPILAFRERH